MRIAQHTLKRYGRSHGSVCNWSLEEDEDKSMLTGTAAVRKWVYNDHKDDPRLCFQVDYRVAAVPGGG